MGREPNEAIRLSREVCAPVDGRLTWLVGIKQATARVSQNPKFQSFREVQHRDIHVLSQSKNCSKYIDSVKHFFYSKFR